MKIKDISKRVTYEEIDQLDIEDIIEAFEFLKGQGAFEDLDEDYILERCVLCSKEDGTPVIDALKEWHNALEDDGTFVDYIARRLPFVVEQSAKPEVLGFFIAEEDMGDTIVPFIKSSDPVYGYHDSDGLSYRKSPWPTLRRLIRGYIKGIKQ